jgi:hypothetical protein
MIKDIIEFFKIGKELGLTKRELSSLFFLKNSKHRTLSIFLLVILIIISITFISVIIVFYYINIERNIYASGTYYSTVKNKDFLLKKDKAKIS